jgi:hypothetical protein
LLIAGVGVMFLPQQEVDQFKIVKRAKKLGIILKKDEKMHQQ